MAISLGLSWLADDALYWFCVVLRQSWFLNSARISLRSFLLEHFLFCGSRKEPQLVISLYRWSSFCYISRDFIVTLRIFDEIVDVYIKCWRKSNEHLYYLLIFFILSSWLKKVLMNGTDEFGASVSHFISEGIRNEYTKHDRYTFLLK